MKMLAFVQLRTTGSDPLKHEIVEVGLVRVSPRNLEALSEMSLRAKPTRPEAASSRALKAAGYDPHEWWDALSLKEAMKQLTPNLHKAVLCGHDAEQVRAFLDAAWKKTGVPPAEFADPAAEVPLLAPTLLAISTRRTANLKRRSRRVLPEASFPDNALGDAQRSSALACLRLQEVLNPEQCEDDIFTAKEAPASNVDFAGNDDTDEDEEDDSYSFSGSAEHSAWSFA